MTELLNCTGLSKAYGKKRALDHVDLHLEPGKIIGLLGPNGSGKTTLMKLANGLLQPTEGSITIAGSVPGPATKDEHWRGSAHIAGRCIAIHTSLPQAADSPAGCRHPLPRSTAGSCPADGG